MASYFDEFLNKPRDPANPFDLNNFLSNYPGRDRIQELQQIDFQNNPRDTATGTASDFRHSAAMNELSKSLSPGFVPDFVGDSLAYGLGAINEIPDAFRGFSFREGFDPQSMADAKEDFSANYAGSFGTPNTATIEDVFAKTLGYQAPGTNIQTASAVGNPMGYGAAQASDLTNLERDFPGMSTGDIIDSMNNRPQNLGFIESAPQPKGMSYEQMVDLGLMGPDQDVGMTAEDLQNRPSFFGNIQNKIGSGLGSLKDFAIDKGTMGKNLIGSAGAMALGLPGIIGSLLSNFGDGVDYQQYTPGFDYKNLNPSMINDFYNPKTGLNRFDRARKKGNTFASSRTLAEYFEKRKVKKAAEAQAKQAAREAATAARAMAKNPQVYSNAGITSGGFASQNTGTNQGFSNKSGRGRTGYSEGGLASMFTRRG